MLHTPTAIRVQHLSHRFGSTEVLHDIGFEVGEGEIFGFIGPNGAGKTTTIRAMATLLEPTAGRIEIGGIDVLLEPERVRPKIGYMADQAGLYPKLTLEEFLAFFAAAYRLAPRAVDVALELTGLTDLRQELAGTLSKGMRQRLQLAKTLLHDPAVLILDEPASDLDPRARIAMRDLLLYLSAARKTVFLSSHILTELSDVCTSVGVIEKGRLLAFGPIAEITRQLGAPHPAASAGDARGDAQHVVRDRPAGRSIKLRTLGPVEPVMQLLQRTSGVLGVHASGGHLFVRLDGSEHLVAEIVRVLVSSGIGVVGVEPERDELEAVFLELTRRGPS
ncbi:MAG TPA: ABC transporter ATP-binding protein [Polyangiaceae bacterium]|nr:ABC transporter ATP-binding protein [Polyangiaceae bacterium]